MSSATKLTSEVRLLDAANPKGEFSVVAPRRFGVEYDVGEDASDRLLILHNDGAQNFELARPPSAARRVDAAGSRPRGGPAAGRGRVPSCLMVYYRRDGMTGLPARPGRR